MGQAALMTRTHGRVQDPAVGLKMQPLRRAMHSHDQERGMAIPTDDAEMAQRGIVIYVYWEIAHHP